VSPAILAKLRLVDERDAAVERAQREADDAAALRAELAVAHAALQSLVDVVTRTGGYLAVPDQQALRSARSALARGAALRCPAAPNAATAKQDASGGASGNATAEDP
jgi:hypothetical protein